MFWTNNGMEHYCFDKIIIGSHLPVEKVLEVFSQVCTDVWGGGEKT